MQEAAKTRHGKIDLDLSTRQFLTKPDVTDPRAIRDGEHFVRTGVQDPKKLPHGAHPQGDPVRVATDKISGKMFVQIIEHLPAEEDGSTHATKLHDRARKHRPYHVPGHGFWIPLHELFPDHPHANLNHPNLPE